jgi:hypothetical protein
MRQEIIEQKLARLGVERGSGAAYLPSQAHGRAFSVCDIQLASSHPTRVLGDTLVPVG